jgi:hypothetical protein
MAEINSKSLIIGIILGFAAWLWAFIIVGSAVYDFAANKPRPFDFGFYLAMLIVTAIVSIVIFALYLWKYEQNNPIITNGWAIDAIILGIIICAMNFIFDIIFFGLIMHRNLISYFFLETTTGYAYPFIILEILIIAYLIYGRKSQ